MKNEKKKQKENLRLLRSYSLCACMLFLGGIAFPMPSNASFTFAPGNKFKRIG